MLKVAFCLLTLTIHFYHEMLCTELRSKDEKNQGCKTLSATKLVAGYETLFCGPSRQLLAIRQNSSVINSVEDIYLIQPLAVSSVESKY